MNHFNLRGDLVKALIAEDAIRSADLPARDVLGRAIRTQDLVTALQLHCGYEDDSTELGIALGRLAREDRAMRAFINFVGGSNHTWWNNWEWSLPPSMAPASEVMNGVSVA